MPLHYYRSYIFSNVSHTGYHELPRSDASRQVVYARDIIQIWEEDVVRILEANRPEMRRDTYEWEIIRTWDLRVADTKEAWVIHLMKTRQRPSRSKSISTDAYKNSKGTNRGINEIR